MSIFGDIGGDGHDGLGGDHHDPLHDLFHHDTHHDPLHDLHEALEHQEEMDREHREFMDRLNEQTERDRQHFEQQQRDWEEQQRQFDETNRRNFDEQIERERLEAERRPKSAFDHEATHNNGFSETTEGINGAEAAAASTSAASDASHTKAQSRPQATEVRSGAKAAGNTGNTAKPKSSRIPDKIPDFHESLAGVKTYELPIAQKLTGGLELIDSPVAAFEHAGNWYVAPKVNGKIPTDPKSWSLVVDGFEYHPNTRFYHEPANVRMQEAHVDMIQEISSGLTAKQKAGTLLENSTSALKPKDMASIILAKEKEGAGLRLGTDEPLHGFLAERGLDPFKPTHQEVMAANDVTFSKDLDQHFSEIAEKRLAVHNASGKAFMATPQGGSLGGAFSDPRERVFFAPHGENPQELRRLKVGFEELMMPDGTRVHQPSIKETTVSVADAMKEIGPKAHVAHAPEGISSFMQTGKTEGLQEYARTHMASDYIGRQKAHDYFSTVDRGLHQTTTHHMMGEELVGKDLTTQAWHRVVRPEDYVPQVTGSGASVGSTAIETAATRVFDSKRADYFLLREHPDYTAALQSRNFSGGCTR